MAALNFVELEKDVLKKWKHEDVFRKTLAKDSPKGDFVFFEGPPTANGMPHIGHVETRAFKDLIPRFKTMQGYRVERKAGWDTQGLPVELEVEKAIGVSGKKDIETYGIAKFNGACKQSVWKYKDLWEKMTERVGFWLDLEHPYVTYQNDYIETLWWILKKAWDAKLFMQDYKVVPYCPRCGTALSSHEVAQGYERVKDRSVYVKFELVDEPGTFVLSWTTTPWTLPGNVALAVKEDIPYLKVRTRTTENGPDSYYVLAKKRLEAVFQHEFNVDFDKLRIGVTASPLDSDKQNYKDKQIEIVEEFSGKNLVGKQYKPLFDFLDLRSHHPAPRQSSGHPSSGRRGEDSTTPSRPHTRRDTPAQVRRGSGGAAYTVVPADFVTTDEGTGVVHTAVMYGEDDFQLGTKLDLPKRHTVDEQGKFNGLVKPWAGKYVKSKDVEDGIVSYLKEHGELYAEEQYEHDYPFCWRCKNPLLYYAKTSWFITMSKLRDELIANNEKINWVPNHIKDGRFGEWLREVKDWAISRERYWGTPLPIWVCDQCKHQECLGSYEELLQKLPIRNRFIFVRHGEATISVNDLINTDVTKNAHVTLTELGRKQAAATAKALKKNRIDLVVSSDFIRTKQTAEIIAQEVGATVTTDSRLDEYEVGPTFEGKTTKEYHAHLAHVSRFHAKPEGGIETWLDVRTRLFDLLHELDRRYEGKTIVLVSHGDPIFVAMWAASLKAESQIDELPYPTFAQAVDVAFPARLFQADGSFDPHRPFIDSVTWECEKCGSHASVPRQSSGHLPSGRGGTIPSGQPTGHPYSGSSHHPRPPADPSSGRRGVMRRVPEVADTWFDSGSMPYAQWHYPFENKGQFGRSYPAAFISEAIDQTRGWFYTLLAISTFLQKADAVKKGPPYGTCVVLGHIRDKDGKKLSKSLGNYIDPMKLLDKYGADAVRMYLFTINQPSEPKNFDEAQLGEVVKKNFMILWNVLSFWKLFAAGAAPAERPAVTHVMDRWVLALLDRTTVFVTKKLEQYAIVDAGRELMGFVTDLSTWYVRRSRERAKGERGDALVATLGYVLRQYAKLSAPFTPFLADALWREVGGGTSVHLEEWPKPGEVHNELLTNMARARKVVEIGHALRAQARMKVRQPLSQIVVMKELLPDLDDILILKDELNVKDVVTAKKLPLGPDWVVAEGVALDVTVTDELREEGYLREMVRAINALRKALKLKPGEPVAVAYDAEEGTATYVEHFKKTLMEKGSVASLRKVEKVNEPSVSAELDGKRVTFGKA